MPETRSAREIAEHIIRDAVSDIEWMTVGEMTEDESKALGEEAYDKLRHEVDDLVRKGTVKIAFPETPEAAPECWCDSDPCACPGSPGSPETAMRPQDVPEELIDLAMTGARPGCRDDAAFYLANVLPTDRAAERAKVVEEFVSDVLGLAKDYGDESRDVIASMPFLATLDQICWEKYGVAIDHIAREDTDHA